MKSDQIYSTSVQSHVRQLLAWLHMESRVDREDDLIGDN